LTTKYYRNQPPFPHNKNFILPPQALPPFLATKYLFEISNINSTNACNIYLQWLIPHELVSKNQSVACFLLELVMSADKASGTHNYISKKGVLCYESKSDQKDRGWSLSNFLLIKQRYSAAAIVSEKPLVFWWPRAENQILKKNGIRREGLRFTLLGKVSVVTLSQVFFNVYCIHERRK